MVAWAVGRSSFTCVNLACSSGSPLVSSDLCISPWGFFFVVLLPVMLLESSPVAGGYGGVG